MHVGGIRFRRFRFQFSSPLRCQCFCKTPFGFCMGIIPFLDEFGHTLSSAMAAVYHSKRERRHADQTSDNERGRVGEHDGDAVYCLSSHQRNEPEDSRRNTCDRPHPWKPLRDTQEFR